MQRNNDPFAPWNDPIYRNDPFAPHNDPIRRDDPFAPWNQPLGSVNDLSHAERAYYGVRRGG